MTIHPSPKTDEIQLEARAHALRIAMLSNSEFMAGIDASLDAEREGRIVPLAELDRELDWAD